MVFSFMSLYNNSNSVSGTSDTQHFFWNKGHNKNVRKYYCVAMILVPLVEKWKKLLQVNSIFMISFCNISLNSIQL